MDIVHKLPQCAETDKTAIYRYLVEVIKMDDMKQLANYLLADIFGINSGSDKVKAAMPVDRVNTDSLFLESLLEMVREHYPSALMGKMIYEAMMKFSPATAGKCKSFLFDADQKSRSSASHDKDNDNDNEDLALLPDIPSERPQHHQDVLLLLQAQNEHVQLYSKQLHVGNVVIHELLRGGLDLSWVHLTQSQCEAVGNVLQMHGRHCGPLVNFEYCAVDNVRLQLLATGLQTCVNVTSLFFLGNNITDGKVLTTVTGNMAMLQRLGLQGNKIGDSGVELIAEILQKRGDLECLDLSYTKLTSSSLPALTALLQHCSKLTEVWMYGIDNDLRGGSDREMEQFIDAVQSSSLRRLYMPARCNVTEYLYSQLKAIENDRQHSLADLQFW